MSHLRSRVAAAWNNEPPKRYVPRAINGGPAWEVWDSAEKRFMSDQDLLAVPLETIKSELIS